MRISQRSLFDLPVLPLPLPDGIRLGQGWDPSWPGVSAGAACSLLFAREVFPQPVPLVLELAVFDTPRLLTIRGAGMPEMRVAAEAGLPLSVALQSPAFGADGPQDEGEMTLTLDPPGARGRDTGWMSGLRLLAIEPPAPAIAFPLQLADAAVRAACLGSGWSQPEPAGIWSEGARAGLILPRWLWQPCAALVFDVVVLPRAADWPPLGLSLRAGGQLLTRETVTASGPWSCPLRGAWPSGAALELELEFEHPLSPAELGINADVRQLGVFLRSIAAAG